MLKKKRVIDNLPAIFNKTDLRIGLEPSHSIFNENLESFKEIETILEYLVESEDSNSNEITIGFPIGFEYVIFFKFLLSQFSSKICFTSIIILK